MSIMEIDSKFRLQIINTVLEHISSNGFKNIKFEIISKKSGVPVKTVNKYFDDEDEMIFQSFQVFFEEYFRKVSMIATPGLGIKEYLILLAENILDPIENLNNKYSSVKLDNKKKYDLFLHFYSKTLLDENYKKTLKMLFENYLNYISERINSYYEKNFINSDSKKTAYKIISVIEGFFINKILGYEIFNKNETKKICINLINNMI